MATENLSYGSFYLSTTAPTTTTTNTPTKALGTTTAGMLSGFSHVGSNRLRKDGPTTRVYEVTVALPYHHPAQLRQNAPI